MASAAAAAAGASTHEALDQLALSVVRNLPHGLFLALAALVLGLILKDLLNGLSRRPFLNPDRWQPLTLVDIKVRRGRGGSGRPRGAPNRPQPNRALERRGVTSRARPPRRPAPPCT